LSAAPGAPSRVAASGLFLLFALGAISAGAGPPRPLALLAAGAGLTVFAATRAAAAQAFGALLSPLVLLADLGLILAAAVATGGPASPFGLLLPARLALAWHGEGRTAARFFAAVSVPAGALALAWSEPVPKDPARLFLPAIFLLATPALLAALSVSAPAAAPAAALPAVGAATPAAPASEPASTRDRRDGLLHDLKSPISVIRVYSDLIRESAAHGQLANPEHLDNLAREVDLAEKLLGADTSRSRASSPAAPASGPEPAATPPNADLVEILGSLATAYRLGQGAHHRIEFIAERPQLTVAADPVALQRAFRNVIENALKYTKEGGEVRIRAGAAGPDAFVVVQDTGIGMSPEERARAFDYAFRGTGAVRSGRPGKGIGLALTREILESNGGRIAISSEAGYGSEVTILLPFQRGSR
jgi:signal transduction histidine kinase